MNLRLIFSLIVLLLTGIMYNAKSQVSISGDIVELTEMVKNGTTYVIMDKPNSRINKEYAEIFRKYWTISKIEFIDFADIDKYLTKTNTFLSVNVYWQQSSDYSGGVNNLKEATVFFYFDLWMITDDYQKPKKGATIDDMYKKKLARVGLYSDKEIKYTVLRDEDSIYQFEYDFDGHFYNWSPGLLKNYLQTIVSHINEGKKRGGNSNSSNKKEIKKLRSSMLYVPEFNLLGLSDKEKSKLFEDYSYRHAIISTEELNKKILTDPKPIYYIMFVRSGASESYVLVLNGQNGELVYTKYYPMAVYKFKSKHLEHLKKEIDSN